MNPIFNKVLLCEGSVLSEVVSDGYEIVGVVKDSGTFGTAQGIVGMVRLSAYDAVVILELDYFEKVRDFNKLNFIICGV